MQGIGSRPFVIDAYRVWTQSRKTSFNHLIAKLVAKAKAAISPYFGMNDFAFVPVYAQA